MRAFRLALMLPAALALAACEDMGMGGGDAASVNQPAPVTPGKVTSSNPATDPAAAAAAAQAAGNPPM